MTTKETIKSAKELVKCWMEEDIPGYLHGAPGVGKSSIFQQVADEEKIGFIDIRLGTKLPEDLSGIPVPNLEKQIATWLKAEFWPDVKRDGPKGIILFDELSDTSRAIQSCAYQVILDRRIGNVRLPEGWWPCAAGNRREDRAAAQSLSTALANRFSHAEVLADVDATIEYFNMPDVDVDPMICGFLRFRPNLLHSMEGANLLAFPTPRSWEKASRFVKYPAHLRQRLMASQIGAGPASEFEAFVKVDGLPTLEDILANPGKCTIPSEPGTKYALSSMLARRIERNNFEKIMTYLTREAFGREFEMCTVLDATKRDSTLCETKTFVNWAKRNKDIVL